MTEDNEAIELKRPLWKRRWFVIAMICITSALLHAWLVWQLPVDADEPTYMSAASEYARLIKAGDIQGIIDFPANREHPPLVKLIYSLPYLLLKPEYGSLAELYFNRGISAFFGVLAVLVLALVDPLAGGLLALHSMTLKYTSEVYLEALPMLAAMLAVLGFDRAQQGQRRWLWWSAVALGVAAAGKYTYLVVIIPIIVMAVRSRFIPWRLLIPYSGAALFTFWALDPALWNDPFQRLWSSLFFHAEYSQSTHVLASPYSWYQPFVWVSNSVPWHPQVFFFPTSDEIVAWLAVPALYLEQRKRPWLIVWLIGGLAILLLWPTKWPQYSLIVTVAMCLLASSFARWAVNRIREENERWDWLEEMLPRPHRIFWVALIGFVFVLVSGTVVNQIQTAVAKRDWMSVSEGISPLPSNTVNDIVSDQGEMLIATSEGLVVWTPSEEAPWGGGNKLFTTRNSGLASDRINCAYADSRSVWWFCTDKGLNRFDGQKWETFTQTDLRQPTGAVRAVQEDSRGGIWAATLAGASYWDGTHWQPYPADGSALPVATLFDLVVQPMPAGDLVWFGTSKGITRLETATQTWVTDEAITTLTGLGGINDLLVDSSNRLWAATAGGGLGEFDGKAWHFSLASNSNIPYNQVQSLFEESPGVLWAGFSYSTEPGGIVARYNGKSWTTFTPKNSGYNGGEPYAISKDINGRIWIGQAAGGIMIFTNPK